MALEQDRVDADGGAAGLPLPTTEGAPGPAAHPVRSCPVHAEQLPGDTESPVPGGLQGQAVGVQLLFPEKSGMICRLSTIVCHIQII